MVSRKSTGFKSWKPESTGKGLHAHSFLHCRVLPSSMPSHSRVPSITAWEVVKKCNVLDHPPETSNNPTNYCMAVFRRKPSGTDPNMARAQLLALGFRRKTSADKNPCLESNKRPISYTIWLFPSCFHITQLIKSLYAQSVHQELFQNLVVKSDTYEESHTDSQAMGYKQQSSY